MSTASLAALPRTMVQDVLMPAYVKAFECQGAQCPDTCCARWTVTVDKESFQVYRRITHPKLKPLFKQFLVQVDPKSQKKHGVLHLRTDTSQCGLLDDLGWCQIQRQLGEQALCDTCFSYPRHTVQINGQTEQHLTLSCPHAARLALTMPDAFAFTAAQVPIRPSAAVAIAAVHGFAPESVDAARLFAVQLCQTEDLVLTEKLIALGWLCQQIDALISMSLWQGMEVLLADLVGLVESGELRRQATLLATDTTVGTIVLASLFAKVRHHNISDLQAAVFEAVRKGLELDKVDAAPIDLCYRKGRSLLDLDGGRSEAALSRYVLNEVLREMFPWQESTCLGHFQKLVARVGIVRLMLAGTAAASNAQLDDDAIIQVVHVFARHYQHNDQFIDEVRELLSESGMTRLEHLYALLL